jgi:hypothetical protein
MIRSQLRRGTVTDEKQACLRGSWQAEAAATTGPALGCKRSDGNVDAWVYDPADEEPSPLFPFMDALSAGMV